MCNLLLVLLLLMIGDIKQILRNKDWDLILKKYDAHIVKCISEGDSKYECVVSRFECLFIVNLYKIANFKWNSRSVLDESKYDYYNNVKLKGTIFKVINIHKHPKTSASKLTIQNIITGKTAISTTTVNFKFLERSTDKVNTKLEKLKKVHGDKYDYSKTIYVNSKQKSIVTCKVHGDFMLDWANAFSKSTGCPKCANILKGYGKSNFINVANNKNVLGCLYFIKLKEENETFYKIGITTNTIKDRCYSIPYKKEGLLLVHGDAEDIYSLEKFIHKKFATYSYMPEKYFAGRMECFNFDNELEIKNYIKDTALKCVKNLHFD